MNEIMRVEKKRVGDNEINSVNARELWIFLKSKQEFAHWIKGRIKKYNFVEGTDYAVDKNVNVSTTSISKQHDYFISIDMAKQLAMVENNSKGQEARKYFIECENKLKELSQPILPGTYIEALKALVVSEENKEQLRIENKQQSETIKKNKPLVSFAETIAKTSDAVDIGQFAKLIKDNGIGFGRNRLFEWLRINKYLMSDNVPYQKFIDNGYFQVIESCYSTPYGEKLYVKTLVTGRGQIAIIERLKLVK